MYSEKIARQNRRLANEALPEGGWMTGAICASAEEQKKETRKPAPERDEAKGGPSASVSKKGEKIKEELDKVMDEIDAVLEENAEEFVKNYVQRGGE